MSVPHYFIVSGDGIALAEVEAFECALSVSRVTPGAIAVLGPTGTPLARVAHGDSVWSEADVRRVARMWRRGAAAP